MRKMIFAIALIMGTSAGVAFAQDNTTSESQSKMTIDEAKDSKNKVAGDLDTEITNAKLRAESGSKSRWSGSFTGSYYGGSLETPFSKYRPNTSQETTPPRVNLSGDVSARYRIDKNQSVTLSTGVSIQDPIHEAKKGDVSDPYLSYNYATKLGTVQSISTGILGAITNNDEVSLGMQAQAVVDQTFMYDFNGSKFSAGVVLEGVYTLHENNRNSVIAYHSDPDDRFIAGTQQRDYALNVYPMAEYAFTDKLSLRTVFRPWMFDHYVSRYDRATKSANDTPWDTLHKRRWSQSFGVGWAVTRDIYLYPNFQWDWEQWRGNDFNFFAKDVRANSTIALQATVNVF